VQIAEAVSWDGLTTSGLRGGFSTDWPERGVTSFFGALLRRALLRDRHDRCDDRRQRARLRPRRCRPRVRSGRRSESPKSSRRLARTVREPDHDRRDHHRKRSGLRWWRRRRRNLRSGRRARLGRGAGSGRPRR
jgi:hypothetical protein